MRTTVAIAAFAAVLGSTLPASAAAVRTSPFAPALSPAARGVAADVSHALGVKDLGPLPATVPVQIGVLLRYRHENELAKLTELQSDPHSSAYHKFLSKAQWNAYFAPDVATYRQVAASLQSRGFTVGAPPRDYAMVNATAPAATAEKYFATRLDRVAQLGRGLRYVNTTQATMPAELQNVAVSVAGLHSTVLVHSPLHFYGRTSPAELARKRAASTDRLAPGFTRPVAPPVTAATPKIGAFSTPPPNPNPDPTEAPNVPLNDMNDYGGYGPPIFADAYDYPVQHGYGGKGYAAGSIIDTDFSDADIALEYKTFGIKRTGTNDRVCTDVDPQACLTCTNGSCVYTPDTFGESTLDADAITTLAPAADFYEYLSPKFSDLGLEWAYERVVSDDRVVAVNSSFGGCETDDPSFEYSTNYIAMEGAALGITFAASTGDTGGTSCGSYVMNGAPQTEINASTPADDTYFVGVGGTDFSPVTGPIGIPTVMGRGPYYSSENAWTMGGGGYSIYQPMPSWQAAAVAASPIKDTPMGPHTTGRNIPDVSLVADPNPPGVGFDITFNKAVIASGGTSLSSPMFVAMLVEIAQVQRSGSGFVNPALYSIANASPGFAFRDILLGNNIPYAASQGYDDATGLGTPLGFSLAGALRNSRS